MNKLVHGGKTVGERRLVPGKKSTALLALRNKYIPRAMFQVMPIFIARAKGAKIEDVDGNEYLDFTSGIGVLNTGHCHNDVVAAIKEQADAYLHTLLTSSCTSLRQAGQEANRYYSWELRQAGVIQEIADQKLWKTR